MRHKIWKQQKFQLTVPWQLTHLAILWFWVKLSASVPNLCNENDLIPESFGCSSFIWERSNRVGICSSEAKKLKKDKGIKKLHHQNRVRKIIKYTVWGTESGSVWHHAERERDWPSKSESANYKQFLHSRWGACLIAHVKRLSSIQENGRAEFSLTQQVWAPNKILFFFFWNIFFYY